MIRIEHHNLDSIATNYFNSIKQHCLNRASFYLSVYNVLFNNANIDEIINSPVNGKTKVKGVNSFLSANKVVGQLQYANVTIQNLYGWVNNERQTIFDLVTYLSDVNNLEEIILAPACKTFSIDLRLINHFGLANNPNKKELFNLICHILSYEDFHKRVAYDTAASLGVNTCPYCNRIYINTVWESKKRGIIRPSFDHFFPHSKHPFLALSFYNLIPSCYYCNSSLKNATSISYDTHIHPFLEGYGNDCVFRVMIAGLNPDKSDPRNYKLILQSKIDSADPKYRKIFGNNNNEGSNNLFKLQEIYNAHTDIVGELIVKADRYSNAQSNSLYSFFGLLKTNKAEFYQYYFGNYYNDKDHVRRPMAKLTKNILQQVIPDFFKD